MSRRNGIDKAIVLTPCRKLYICGWRAHHGLTGELLALIGLALLLLVGTHVGVVLAAIGAVLVIHDWHDFPFHLIDRPGDGPRALTPGGTRGIKH